MLSLPLYLAQRLSAALMLPLALIHLALMVYVAQGELSSAQILARTQGSLLWALFYASFALAVAAHGAIGLRVIAHEWFGLGARALALLGWAAFALLAALGLRAALAVTLC